jgi:putative transposase
MRFVLAALLLTLRTSLRARSTLQLEILALRHQLQVLERSRPQRVQLTRGDRLLWVWMSRVWDGWRAAVVIVKPETVIAWHRRGFRLFWAWKSRHRMGRPIVSQEVRTLIHTMSAANPLWGAPRIHGELLKLGFTIAQSRNTWSADRSHPRRHGAPSWRTTCSS